MEGFNWLMSKWHNLQSVILADDMGLGKSAILTDRQQELTRSNQHACE